MVTQRAWRRENGGVVRTSLTAAAATLLMAIGCSDGGDQTGRARPLATSTRTAPAPTPYLEPTQAAPTSATAAAGGVIATFDTSAQPTWDADGAFAAVIVAPDTGYTDLPVRLFDLTSSSELPSLASTAINGSCGVRLISGPAGTLAAVIEIQQRPAQGIHNGATEAFLAFYDVASGIRRFGMQIADQQHGGDDYRGTNCNPKVGTVVAPTADNRYVLVYTSGGDLVVDLATWSVRPVSRQAFATYVLGKWIAVPVYDADRISLRRIDLQDPGTGQSAGTIAPSDNGAYVDPAQGQPMVVAETWVRHQDGVALPSGRVRWRVAQHDAIGDSEKSVALPEHQLLLLTSYASVSKPHIKALNTITGKVVWELDAALCGAVGDTVWVQANDSLAVLAARTGKQRSYEPDQPCPVVDEGAALVPTVDAQAAPASWSLVRLP